MKSTILAFFLLLIFAFSCPGKELFKVQIEAVKDTFVLGEPIIVRGTVTYLGKVPININPETARTFIPESCDGPEPFTIPVEHPPNWWKLAKGIPPGWKAEDEQNVSWCISKPRSIKVRYQFSYKHPSKVNDLSDVWEGQISSEFIELQIVAPTGEDKNAFDLILGKEPSTLDLSEWLWTKKDIVEQYPSSIYAAHVYLQKVEWWKSKLSPEKFLVETQKPSFAQPKEYLDDVISKGTTILVAHSNDEYLGPRVMMNLALAYVMNSQHESARRLFARIVEEEKQPEFVQKAKDFIAVMKEKGLTP